MPVSNVALRVAHSVIHLTHYRVMLRLGVSAASALVSVERRMTVGARIILRGIR